MKKRFVKSLVVLVTLICGLVFVCAACKKNQADTSTSDAEVSLTSFEGMVYLEDASGNRKEIAAGDVIGSGDILITGEGGKATVTLAKDRTAYMDENTKLKFVREGNNLDLFVSEGRLLMDVKEKLKENETLRIHTTAITADIRGTIVFVQELPQQTGSSDSRVGILEGAADVSFTDLDGAQRQLSVPAGEKVDAPYQATEDGIWITKVEVSPITQEDLNGFYNGIIQDNGLAERITIGSEIGADGDAVYNGEVTLVAQSASKLYDGTPLTVPSGVLVYGLPEGYSVRANASGSQTNAGSSLNFIDQYTIYNAQGEDVTSHFVNVKKVSGVLAVNPAPFTVWTGSAEKEYDGQPLKCEEAGIKPGVVGNIDTNASAWSNSAVRTTGALGQESVIGISGSTWVQGTDPLNGETQSMELRAGQTLSVGWSDQNSDSLSFHIINLSEDDLPEEVLRLYADNPELLTQACLDAGWDANIINQRIMNLPAGTGNPEKPEVMTDSVNVQITVNPENAQNAHGGAEVNYASISISASIQVTATGSQTAVGESPNTYDLNWGDANRENYIVNEELGTLTVTRKEQSNNGFNPSGNGFYPSNNNGGQPSGDNPSNNNPSNNPSEDKPEETDKEITTEVTFESGSASKVYDGTALSNNTVTVTGLPDGYTYQASCSASITDAGSIQNTIDELKIFDADGKDVTKLFTNVTKTEGTLTVEKIKLIATWECKEETPTYTGFRYFAYIGDVTVTYQNGPHAGETITKTFDESGEESEDPDNPAYLFPLYTGDTITVYASGNGCDAGTYPITLTAQAPEAKTADYSVTCAEASLTISPVELIVETDSAEKDYDGEPLTAPGVTIYRNFDGEELAISRDGKIRFGDEIAFTATGTITEPGDTTNTYSVAWGESNPNNFILRDRLGTLKVNEVSTPTEYTPSASCIIYGAVLDREKMKAAFPELEETYKINEDKFGRARSYAHAIVDEIDDPNYSTADYQASIKAGLKQQGVISEEAVEDGTIGGSIPKTSCAEDFEQDAEESDSINFTEVGGVVISKDYNQVTFPAIGETYNLRCEYNEAVNLAFGNSNQTYASEEEYQIQLRDNLKSKGWI
ncbi:MAG: FecR domain-containing protein [Lachnospiraceae bacterium]|nr:FecR domain-containing protein [Lachnospiraceae bacterium]